MERGCDSMWLVDATAGTATRANFLLGTRPRCCMGGPPARTFQRLGWGAVTLTAAGGPVEAGTRALGRVGLKSGRCI